MMITNRIVTGPFNNRVLWRSALAAATASGTNSLPLPMAGRNHASSFPATTTTAKTTGSLGDTRSTRLISTACLPVANGTNSNQRSLVVASPSPSSSPPLVPRGQTSSRRRHLSSSSSSYDLEGYYHIEASNALEADDDGNLRVVYATKLTVTGPDVDGMLASMTVALAKRGCSLVSLHAAKSEDSSYRKNEEEEEEEEQVEIKDVFYVVDRFTGQPFEDDELYPLAESLLESLRTPMAIIMPLGSSTSGTGDNDGSGSDMSSLERVFAKQPNPPYPTREEQITVVTSTGN